jgi:hypothetical protein
MGSRHSKGEETPKAEIVGQLGAAADRCPLFFRGIQHLAYGIQIRSDVISPFAPDIWRP